MSLSHQIIEGSDHSVERSNIWKQHIHKFGSFLKRRLWLVVITAVVAIGAVGAMLKYLEEDARKQQTLAPGGILDSLTVQRYLK